MGKSKYIAAKDIVISYSTESIREPQLVLTRCDKYPGQIAAHISYIPRKSEEHIVDEGRFCLFFIKKNCLFKANLEGKLDESNEKLSEVDDNDDPDIQGDTYKIRIDN